MYQQFIYFYCYYMLNVIEIDKRKSQIEGKANIYIWNYIYSGSVCSD